ncbi:hypothetical protein SteCoe_23932 [Stentor coeruleus]|uniref:Uncharacterized protein n=1 Tax=Stentor coeruleus TaxID=5963 RepID=A0A1R2BIT9_9CILI|nr:hypothetical protein SteCoe_23932 [Stentor coeruleus]
MFNKRQCKRRDQAFISTPTQALRFSPKAIKISFSKHPAKSHNNFLSELPKTSTPKPQKHLLNRSPIMIGYKIDSFSKFIPLHKKNSKRLSSQSTNQTKNLTTSEATPTNISFSSLPPPQDFDFLLSQLLDYFSSPEQLGDFFFFGRKNLIDYTDFFESCLSLGITEYFSDLRKIFNEGSQRGLFYKQKFLNKAIQIQNFGCKSYKKIPRNHKPNRMIQRIYQSPSDTQAMKSKKFQSLVKYGKSPKKLLHNLSCENASPKLKNKKIVFFMKSFKFHRAKKVKSSMNMTVKVTSSPYMLIPCSIAYRKHLLSLSRTPQRKKPKIQMVNC